MYERTNGNRSWFSFNRRNLSNFCNTCMAVMELGSACDFPWAIHKSTAGIRSKPANFNPVQNKHEQIT